MPELRLIARVRTERLTNEETVKLGRLLTHFLPAVHVWFPEDTETVEVVAEDQITLLAPTIRRRLAEILGEFDERLVD